MRITQEADYALRIVLFLSKLEYGEKVEARIISECENIPMRFLLKIFRKLTKFGLVKSFRGIKGGYALNKLPKDISMRHVIEAIDGPIYMNRCFHAPTWCNLNRTNQCEVHSALSRIQSKLISEMDSIDFKSIIERSETH